MLTEGILISRHLLREQVMQVRSEIDRYHRRHVDFADACLVILSDQHPRLPVITADIADFTMYFRGRSARKLIMPSK